MELKFLFVNTFEKVEIFFINCPNLAHFVDRLGTISIVVTSNQLMNRVNFHIGFINFEDIDVRLMDIRVSCIWFCGTKNHKLVFIDTCNINLWDPEFVNVFIFNTFVFWEIDNMLFIEVISLNDFNFSFIKISTGDVNILLCIRWWVMFWALHFKKVILL